MKPRFRFAACLLPAALLLGSGLEPSGWAQENQFTTLNLHQCHDEQVTIQKLLSRQADAWNEGDLEQFMKAYWKSNDLTFSAGGTTTRGWEATLKRYQSRYAPPQEMGQLKFSQLEITILETRTALVLGNWHLTMKDQSQRAGNYSLVMHKIDGQWRIIHDHSSSLDSAAERPKNGQSPEPGSLNGSLE